MTNITFKFVAEYSSQLENLHELTKEQISQLQVCVPLYYGEEEAEEIDTSRIENLFDEEEERWAFASLYHVMDAGTGEVLYDFWEYNVDSGTVFIHNSPDHIGLFMMQCYFGFAERNKYSKELPADFPDIMQAAYKAARR